jgi:hypothetical protein
LANMTGGSQNFTVETGTPSWRAVAAVTGGNDNTNCSDQSAARLRWYGGTDNNPATNDSDGSDTQSWAATTSTWSVPCYSAVVLVKQ